MPQLIATPARRIFFQQQPLHIKIISGLRNWMQFLRGLINNPMQRAEFFTSCKLDFPIFGAAHVLIWNAAFLHQPDGLCKGYLEIIFRELENANTAPAINTQVGNRVEKNFTNKYL